MSFTMLVVAGWMTLSPARPPAATAAVIEDKAYTMTPAAMRVMAGIVTGEVTHMTKLKEIRLDLAYIPSLDHEETVHFAVSIGGQ